MVSDVSARWCSAGLSRVSHGLPPYLGRERHLSSGGREMLLGRIQRSDEVKNHGICASTGLMVTWLLFQCFPGIGKTTGGWANLTRDGQSVTSLCRRSSFNPWCDVHGILFLNSFYVSLMYKSRLALKIFTSPILSYIPPQRGEIYNIRKNQAKHE